MDINTASIQSSVSWLEALLLSLCLGVALSANAADNGFEDDHFSGSGQCVQCHDGLNTEDSGEDVSIVESWSTSMMANSTRDPYWQAKVSSELHRNPSVSDEINDKCSRCHAPMANEAAKKDGAPVKLFDEAGLVGFLNPDNVYNDHAMDGVSCTACHQISDDPNMGTLSGFSGNFVIEAFANRVDRPAYGQYALPLAVPMQANVQYTPTLSSHMHESKVCSSCHDLKTPFVDATGAVVSTTPESEFPEQMVFSEWSNSAFQNGGASPKSCQACHMPVSEEKVKVANRPETIHAREDFSRHSFLGANTVMMDVLNQNKAALAVTASGFEATITQSRVFLKTAASIEIIANEIVGDNLDVTLKVSNHTGHKLPTGYPSRRAYIHFVVRDENGAIVFESGKTNADGSIVGVNGDVNSSTFEPHYEEITLASQVQVYGPIMQNSDGLVTHTLLRAASYRKDNRLTPAGFNKAIVPNDVAVKGAAVSDSDFNSGSDTIRYSVAHGGQLNLSIEAELKYQTLSFGHLQDLFNDSAAVPKVKEFKGYFETAGIRSETLASANAEIGDHTAFFVIPMPEGKAVIFGL